MPNLLAMSFEGSLTPAFDLHCLDHGRVPPDGWGIACYPDGEPAALVLKEAAPAEGSARSTLVSAWERLESSIFVVHIRTAKWGAITEANTQPFQRPWGRREWILAHSGSLETKLDLTGQRFEPIGSTDSEQIFCTLLTRIASRGWRSLAEVPPEQLLEWLAELNGNGPLTIAFADGNDLCVYADRRGQGAAYVYELLPPHGKIAFGDNDLTVDLTRRGIRSRKGIIVSSDPLVQRLGAVGEWRRLMPGHLLIVRQGAVRAEVGPPDEAAPVPVPVSAPAPQAAAPGAAAGTSATPSPEPAPAPAPAIVDAATLGAGAPTAQAFAGAALSAEEPAEAAAAANARPFVPRARPRHNTERAEVRRYSVLHRTIYRYKHAVERSAHLLRLFPMHDRLQAVSHMKVTSSVDGHQRDFEDVFGNTVRRLLIDTPFHELNIEAHSEVELRDVDPLDFRPARVRSTIPLAWMPWQRQILGPFLLPPELPESELTELTDYAMSFAHRNDYELLDTLLDINATIFSEYRYRQGTTSLSTSAFDVFVNRRGVCQDFANLFICLARLLGVPARYACGYLYTGPKAENARMAEASHAWVQVYLPEVGWKGFDPTNGVLTQTNHVRVAVGRNYIDATPTSGTLYAGGGGESLSVEVVLTRV